jgi:TRAP-type C4-dicarboxylate transport system substrate-binding protein
MTLKSAAFAAVMGCAVTPAVAQDYTLHFQHFVSPLSANPTYFMEPWAKAIEEQSGGRLKIVLHPFMELGGAAPEMYDMIADGIVDGGWVIPGYEAGRFPEAEALELPFMTTKSAEEASAAAWEYTQEFLMDDFADVHLIAAHMHGPGLVHKRGPLIETVEDFNGLTLRGPTRTATMLLEKLGATAVGMPVPAFPEALAKGVVDGGAITWEQSPSLKLDELTDSHSDVAGDHALYNLYFLWAMNHDVYDSLPADLQAIIDANSGLYASRWAGYAHDTGDALGREIMAAANDIGEISEAETARMISLGDEVVEEWIAEMDAKGFDGAALVDAARSDVAVAAGTKGAFVQN